MDIDIAKVPRRKGKLLTEKVSISLKQETKADIDALNRQGYDMVSYLRQIVEESVSELKNQLSNS